MSTNFYLPMPYSNSANLLPQFVLFWPSLLTIKPLFKAKHTVYFQFWLVFPSVNTNLVRVLSLLRKEPIFRKFSTYLFIVVVSGRGASGNVPQKLLQHVLFWTMFDKCIKQPRAKFQSDLRSNWWLLTIEDRHFSPITLCAITQPTGNNKLHCQIK